MPPDVTVHWYCSDADSASLLCVPSNVTVVPAVALAGAVASAIGAVLFTGTVSVTAFEAPSGSVTSSRSTTALLVGPAATLTRAWFVGPTSVGPPCKRLHAYESGASPSGSLEPEP